MSSDPKPPIAVPLPVDATAEFADAMGKALVNAGLLSPDQVPENPDYFDSLPTDIPRVVTISMDPDLVQQFYAHLKTTAASCILAVIGIEEPKSSTTGDSEAPKT